MSGRPIEERGWIGIDLDGTLAEYHGWPKDGSIGQPIPAMLDRVKAMVHRMLYHDDMAVRIFTARICPTGRVDASDCAEQKRRIEEWCNRHIGVVLPVVYEKDLKMVTLYDDRCETVEANTGRTLRDLCNEQQSELERLRRALRGVSKDLAEVLGEL